MSVKTLSYRKNSLASVQGSQFVSASSTVTATSDPYFLNVSLLLHGDGSNNANNSTILDSSSNNLSITRNGNPAQGSMSPFPFSTGVNGTGYSASSNGGSIYFNGTTDYLTLSAANTGFAFGTGDFTVEMWVYPTASTQASFISNNYDWASGTGNWAFYTTPGSANTIYFNTTGANHGSSVTTTIPLNAWTHIAYNRTGTAGKFFINGTQLGTDVSDTSNYASASGTVFIGDKLSAGGKFAGYISNLRVIKGAAIYTSNFNVPTAPFATPSDAFATSVIAQLNGEGINNSTTMTDAVAGNSHTAIGGAVLTSAISKYGTSSINLNNGAVSLGGTFSSALKAFTTSSMTAEAWIYPTSISNSNNVISNYSSTITNGMWKFNTAASTGNLGFTWSTGAVSSDNNTFLDSSSNNYTLTRTGTPTQGTFSPFSASGWSNYYNGSSGISATKSGGFLTSGNNFTVEAWVYLTAYPSATYQCIFNTCAASNGWELEVTGTASSLTGLFFSMKNQASFSGPASMQLNTWYHVAAVKNGSTTTLYLNGASIGSTTAISTWVENTTLSMGNTQIGGFNYYFNGYISNGRVVNGTAVYTSNFTPPTAPLTAITNTSVLTAQSNSFIDNSTNAVVFSTNGSPTVQANSPFGQSSAYSISTNGGSVYFNGSTDYLLTPASGNPTMSGDFTIECWVYDTSANTAPSFISMGVGANTRIAVYNNTLDFYCAGAEMWTGTPIKNQWVHYAMTRVGTTVRAFANGVQFATTTSASAVGSATSPISIGALNDGTYKATATISDVRIINGTGLYTANFTPPTGPLTAVANTVFLLSGTNANIIDGTGKNDVTTIGTAASQNSVVKYGSGALKFNGAGDYLAIPSSPVLAIGSGDFTIEFWFYRTVDQNQYLFTIGSSPDWGNNDGVQMLNYSGNFAVHCGTSDNTAVIATPALNTWHHVALVRQSGNVKLYVNGTGTSVFANSTTLTGSLMRVGHGSASGFPQFAGYMDDFRITKGYARYTSNFAVPTAALPNSSTTDSYFQYNSLLLQSDSSPYLPTSSVTSTLAVTPNQWNHVAVVVDSTTPASSTIRLAVNGTMQSFTGNNLSSQTTQYTAPRLGTDSNGNNPANAYIDEVRITSAIRYVANFTPPTAINASLIGPALLVSGTNSAIYDSSAKNNLIVSGDTKTMIAINKFGGSSIYFDGVGDWLTAPHSTALTFGSSDWTVECWIYATTVGNPSGLWGKKVISGYGISLQMSTTQINFFASMNGTTWGVNFNSSVPVVANTWTHVAVTRYGNVFTIWQNGVNVGTQTLAGTIYDNNLPFVIGNVQNDGAYVYQGYIDDFRYTNGVARYTTAFTTPSVTFSDK